MNVDMSCRAGRRGAVALAAALVLLAAGPLAPPPARSSDPDPARAFDFWIGQWQIDQRILQADGSWIELPAHTSVTPAVDGHAFVERWRGRVQFFWEGMTEPAPLEGLSVRAYDPETKTWYIHWMDNMTPRFGDPYAGTIAGGHGEFYKEWNAPDGSPRVGRITFSQVTPDSVDWALAVSRDARRTWQTLWTMAMHRVPARDD